MNILTLGSIALWKLDKKTYLTTFWWSFLTFGNDDRLFCRFPPTFAVAFQREHIWVLEREWECYWVCKNSDRWKCQLQAQVVFVLTFSKSFTCFLFHFSFSLLFSLSGGLVRTAAGENVNCKPEGGEDNLCSYICSCVVR